MPANAMDMIKELRKTSGAPISDVKVTSRSSHAATAAAPQSNARRAAASWLHISG
jgi:hypothetical protein